MDDLIKQLRDMMYRMSWDDAKKLGEIIAALDGSTLATSKANAALEAAKARITALESERATLLHNVEIHAQEAERLDFMIEKEAGVWTNGWQWMVMQCAVEDPDILGVGKTPREAIDAALANQKKAG
jgi:hypothetical protein